ncbi:MAG: 50S ribosomal protein L9 [Chloroflexi bacterium]|nr:50S ribosomal protein L9 [Chloroflexota bacterium]
MKIVLIDEVPNLGIAGDVREVKDGFGRNYLLPKKLAVKATVKELARADALRTSEVARRARLNQDMFATAEDLKAETLVVRVRVGPAGRLYGSVTATEIAERVSERIGQEVDRRAVDLPHPIREVGVQTVRIRLAPDVFVDVPVSVEPEGGLAPTADTISEAVEAELNADASEESDED